VGRPLGGMSGMRVERVLETCLYVDDLAAAERFYADVLGLRFVAREAGRHVFLRCGDSMVLLFRAEETAADDPDGEIPPHGCRGAGHAAFAMGADEVERWREHLARHRVPIEREIDRGAGARSLYFRDPAGNSLELGPPAMWGLSDGPTQPL